MSAWDKFLKELETRGVNFADVILSSDKESIIRECGVRTPLEIAAVETRWFREIEALRPAASGDVLAKHLADQEKRVMEKWRVHLARAHARVAAMEKTPLAEQRTKFEDLAKNEMLGIEDVFVGQYAFYCPDPATGMQRLRAMILATYGQHHHAQPPTRRRGRRSDDERARRHTREFPVPTLPGAPGSAK